MIDLELNKLKQLNAQLAEWTIGQVVAGPDGSEKWDPFAEYMKGVAPEGSSSPTHLTERKAIDWISRRLPAGALVVEVGTLLGGSAAVWANANPLIQVKAIDVFDLDQWISILNFDPLVADQIYQKLIGQHINNKPWTVEVLQEKFKHYANLEFVKGISPGDFVNSELDDIDVYFEDSDHSNPGLARNLDFWCSRVKSKGLVLLHDYAPYLPEYFIKPAIKELRRFPDVESEVDRLIKAGYTLEGTVHSLAILRKP